MIKTITEFKGNISLDGMFANCLKNGDREPRWLLDLRNAGMDRFNEVGIPTKFDEEWKYTDVSRISGVSWSSAALGPVNLDSFPLQINSKVQIVLVNGKFSLELSCLSDLPTGLIVCSLTDSLSSHEQIIGNHLGRYVDINANSLTALNTALMTDGAFIHVAKNAVIAEPIQILHISSADSGDCVSTIRNLFVVEEGAQANVVETYWGADNVNYWVNAVTEIAVAPNASFEHVRVNIEGDQALHTSTQRLNQSSDSHFKSTNICFGGGVTRNDLYSYLGGSNIESTINGVYVTTERQHVDNHTAIDHAFPHCNSHELYKGIMAGRSAAVFNGKIFVRLDAQKTDAKQTNKNLLISPDAAIYTKPQLEIFADDVKCTHGATIGCLDSEAIFYLRSRGIGELDARNMLIHAFAWDVIERISIEPLRDSLEKLLYAKLQK